ncbi:hypothetical protein [uncultured Paracoccus sp.]|uniref:hypothetical protein n=1 Tax=uncultured Paracoccus sp. TaxID=189685 RepID=UPI0025D0285D|nr:hypothetical protein [uncultured Paracoccus sp.]
MRLFAIAATLIALAVPFHAAPVQAATVTDPAASVTLWNGDIVAEATALASDDASFAPSFAMIAGGVTGFDPAFALLIEDASGEIGYGEADSFSFDGDRIVSFLFNLTGAATAWLGDTVALTLTFDQAMTAPFAADADFSGSAQWTMAQAAPAPVPLPATLPMLAGGIALIGILRRKARAQANPA